MIPGSEAQAQLMGSRLFLRQPVRSCRRWQLTFLQPGLTRIAASSACPRVRPIHVEASTPPVFETYDTIPRRWFHDGTIHGCNGSCVQGGILAQAQGPG